MGNNPKLLKVLDYVEQNIRKAINMQDMTDVVGYSIPQLYRLFKQLTGDTISEYVVRRKMSEAAIQIKQSQNSITDIAYQYGFQSHDVFTRSFKRVYGMRTNISILYLLTVCYGPEYVP